MEPMRDMPSHALSNILNIMTEMASVQLKIVQASLHQCIFDLENLGDPSILVVSMTTAIDVR